MTPREPEHQLLRHGQWSPRDIGQLALAVLDGGLFAPRRALELAGRVLDRESGQGVRSRVGRED